jgi:Holliday junction resolvase RusA-like endonuclease
VPVFELPAGLTKVAYFTVPRVQTWGSQADAEYKEQVRRASGIRLEDEERFEWFVFCIRCVVGESRGLWKHQVPDVENVPKLIVDAFTGLLYPDDDLHHVRGVQVEAEWGSDEQERAEIWIYGMPLESALVHVDGD